MITLTSSQQTAIDQDNPQSRAIGNPISTLLASILSAINTSAIGISADSRDVNDVAAPNGTCRWDNDAAPGTSLLFAWRAGRMSVGTGVVIIIAGSLTLAASAINYVEVDKTGTVLANTAGFTAGRLPLFIVTAGVSSYAPANVVVAKPGLGLVGPATVSGTILTTAAATKEIGKGLGASVTVATSVQIVTPNVAAVLAAARFVSSTAVATNDASYWTFSIVNQGPAGTAAVQMLTGGPASTTKATGGSALVANVAKPLGLSATPANLITAASDVLLLTVTPTGSPPALTLAEIALDFVFAA